MDIKHRADYKKKMLRNLEFPGDAIEITKMAKQMQIGEECQKLTLRPWVVKITHLEQEQSVKHL